MSQLTVNGHRYHVDSSGQGEPLVLLHGFTGDTSTWQAVREELEAHYRVIAIDIIGHGQSDKPHTLEAYTMSSAARDILALLEQLAVKQAHLLGYSMGGRLALYLALHYPEAFQSLILESASAGLATDEERDERRARDNALADKIETNGILWFVDFWQGLSLWDSQQQLSTEVLQMQRDQRLRNTPHGLANSLRGMGTGVQPNLWGDLHQLILPTQLIVGEYDDKFIMINQMMAQKIPDTHLNIITSAGHTVHLENLPAFVTQVQHFLNHISRQKETP